MKDKVLFVCKTNPFDTSFGAAQRTNIILKALIACGYEVDIAYVGIEREKRPVTGDNYNIAFWNEDESWDISMINRIFRLFTVNIYPECKNLSRNIELLIEKNDYKAIVCRYMTTAYTCGLNKFASKLIVDFDDMPTESLIALMPAPKDRIHGWYYDLIFNSCKRKTKWFFRSPARILFANEIHAKKYNKSWLPNISAFHVDRVSHLKNCKRVIFIGKLDYLPNRNGIDRFLNNIWSKVIIEVPDAEFVIAGKGLTEDYKQRWESYGNVRVVGFVEDIIDFYNSSNIAVCPIYTGSGTNIKSIESLSMGKATILTDFSAKGISELLKDGENVLISKSDTQFANHLINILKDQSLCLTLQNKGFELASKLFSLNQILNIISKEIDKVSQ